MRCFRSRDEAFQLHLASLKATCHIQLWCSAVLVHRRWCYPQTLAPPRGGTPGTLHYTALHYTTLHYTILYIQQHYTYEHTLSRAMTHLFALLSHGLHLPLAKVLHVHRVLQKRKKSSHVHGAILSGINGATVNRGHQREMKRTRKNAEKQGNKT